MKKKDYMKPQMKVVELQMRNTLLVGSAVGRSVYEDPADDDLETL